MVLINQFINFKIGGVTIIATSTELNYNSGTIPGSVIAGKTVVVDSNNDIVGFNTVEAVNFTGEITTSAQPNITSLGTITNLLSSGTNIHGIDGSGLLRTTTNNNNIYLQPSVTNLVGSSTNLFITNSQQDITTSSKIFSVMLDGKVGIQSSNPTKQLEINSSNGNNLRLTYNNTTGTATTFTDISTESTGHLVITTSGDFTQITKKLQVNDVILNFNTGGLIIKSISTDNNVGRVINSEITNTLNITNYNTGSITDNFSLEIIGYIRPLYNETYTFFIGWDDDIRFFINGELLLNKVGVGVGTGASSNNIALLANVWYPIFIQNSETSGNQLIQVEWSSASQTREFIPSSRMAWDNKEPSVQMKSNIGDKLTLFNLGNNTLPAVVSLNCTSNGNLNIIPTNKFVGINKSVPTSILHLFSNETSNDTINVENTTTTGYASVNHISNLVNWSSGARSSLNSNAPNSYFINGGSSPSLKFVINSDGNIGINTVKADRKMEINDTTGNCLRLTFNDADGSATTYSDFLMKNTGSLEITTSGGLLKLLSPVATNELNISSNTVLLNLDSTLNTSSADIQFNTSGNDWILTGRGSSNLTNPNTFSIYDNTNALYRLILDTSGNINIVAHNSSTVGLRLGGTLITSSANELNYLDLTTGPGTAEASKVLVLNSSSNITGINSLTATSLIGTIGTSSQPSITSLGTLSGLNVSGHVLMGTISEGNPRIRVTSLSTVLYLQTGISTTTGSTCDLFIGNIGENTVSSARKFIYKADGKMGIGTILPTRQLDINSSTGDCLRLIYNDTDGSATNFADFLLSSGGNLTITPSGGDMTITGNLTTTISTPAQPNITSVGTLTSLSIAGAFSGATTINASSIVTLTASTVSTNTTTGALVVAGGVGIGGAIRTNGLLDIAGAFSGATTINASGIVTLTNSTVSTSITTGALVVTGGLGISGATSLSTLRTTGNVGIGISLPTQLLDIQNTSTNNYIRIGAGSTNTDLYSGILLTEENLDYGWHIRHSALYDNLNIGYQSNLSTFTSLLNFRRVLASLEIPVSTVSTNTTTGALVISGGLGIGGAIHSGGIINTSGIVTITSSTVSSSTTTGALVVTGGVGIGGAIRTNGLLAITGAFSGATTINASGIVTLTNNTTSTNTTTGALVITGGLGVGGTINATSFTGSILTAVQTNITSLGTLTSLTLSGAISGVTTLTATTLAGTLSTTSQPNITSVGTLTSLTISGATTLTAGTASTTTTTGTLVITGGLGVSGAINATSFTGSILTPAQTSITSLGQLSALNVNGTANIGDLVGTTGRIRFTASGSIMYIQSGTTASAGSPVDLFFGDMSTAPTTSTKKIMFKGSGKVGIDTINPQKQLEVNSLTGDCLRLSYNDVDGNDTNYVDFIVSSGGDLTIDPNGGDVNITGNTIITGDATITGVLNATLSTILINDKLGVGTNNPTMQAEINNVDGNCLRLTFNDANGGATIYSDFLVSSTGHLTIDPSGGNTIVDSNVQVNGTISNFNTGGLIVNVISSSSGIGRIINKNITTTLNITDYNTSSITDNFGLEIIGYIQPLYSETYTFFIGWDDDIRVFINNELIMNRYGIGLGTGIASNTIALTANVWYPIFIQNIEETGSQRVQVEWSSTSQTREYIPSSRMAWDNKESNITRKPFAGDSLTIYSLGAIDTINTVSLNCSSTGDLTITPSGGDTAITGTLSGITTLTATTLAGTLSTVAQPNITSVGTLTSLNITSTNEPNLILSQTVNTKYAGMQLLTDSTDWLIGAGSSLHSKINTYFIFDITTSQFRFEINSAGSVNINAHNSSTVGLRLGGALVTSSATELNYLDLTTGAGTAEASKALVLNSSSNITGINSLTATTLVGTISTASQPNITSLGILTGLVLSGTISGVTTLTATSLVGTISTASQPNITSLGTLTSLVLSGTISGVTTLTATSLVGTISTASQPNITSLGTLTGLVLSGTISGVTTLTATLLVGTISTASQPNITSLGTLTGLVLSGTISGVTTLTATSLVGTISTASQPNITSLGTLTGLTVTGNIGLGTISPTEKLNIYQGNIRLSDINSYTNNRYIYTDWEDASNNHQIGLEFDYYTGSGTTITTHSMINFISNSFSGENINGAGKVNMMSILSNGLVGIGTTNPGRQLEINSTNGNCLRLTHNDTDGSATNYADFLVSSIGELTINPSGNWVYINSNVIIDHSGTLAFVVRKNNNGGTIFKVDTTNDIITISGNLTLTGTGVVSGITTLTATTLAGTLSTVAQPNITSVGTLASLRTSGTVGIGTTTPTTQLEINSATGNCLRLTNNDPDGSATNYADLLVSSIGELNIQASSGIINLNGYSLTKVTDINLTAQSNTTFYPVAISKDIIGLYGNYPIIDFQITGIDLVGSNTYNENTLYGYARSGGNSDHSSIFNVTIRKFSESEHRILGLYFGTTSFVSGFVLYLRGGYGYTIQSDSSSTVNTGTIGSALTINGSTFATKNVSFTDITGTSSNISLAQDLLLNSGTYSNTSYITSSNITGVNLTGTLTTAAQSNITSLGVLSGLNVSGASAFGNLSGSRLRITEHLNILYLQPGLSATSGSAADLFIGNILETTITSARKIIFKADGKVGFGTSTPAKILEINSIDGNCLRLTHNATNFTDFIVSSGGDLTIDPNGGDTTVDGNLSVTGTLTATSFTVSELSATILTASQPNITSVGTLTNLRATGNVGIGTASPAQLLDIQNLDTDNYIRIGAGGTGANFSGILLTERNLNYGWHLRHSADTDNLTIGWHSDMTTFNTLLNFRRVLASLEISVSTASTSTTTGALVIAGGLGIGGTTNLTTLRTTGNVGIGTTTPNTQLEVNHSTGNCLRLTYNNTANHSTFAVSSGGDLTITPSGNDTTITGNLVISGALTGVTTFSTSGATTLTAGTASTTTTTGTLVITGGLGISGAINTGGILSISNATASTTTSTGALVVSGGLGIGSDTFIGGITTITNATASTTTSTGALVVSGGLGVGGAIRGNGLLAINGGLSGVTTFSASGATILTAGTTSTNTTTGTLVVTGGVGVSGALNATSLGGTLTTAAQTNITSLGTLTSLTMSGAISGVTTLGASGIVTLTNATASTTTSTGALVITGGLGVGGALNVSGTIRFSNTTTTTAPSNGSVVISGGLGVSAINIGGNRTTTSWLTTGAQYHSTASTYTNSSVAATYASAVITSFAQPTIAASNASTITTRAATVYIDNAPVAGTNMTLTNSNSLWIPNGNVLFGATTTSTTTSTGALVVTGGLGVGGAINATSFTGSILTAAQTNITSVGTLTSLSVSGATTLTAGTASTTTTTGTLVITGGLGVSGDINATNLGGLLSTSAQTNITSLGTLTSLNVSSTTAPQVSIENTFSTGYSGLQLNTSGHDWLIGVGGSNYTGQINSYFIRSISNSAFRFAIDPSGNTNIVAHNNSTVGLQLGGTLITSSATELNYLDLTTGTGTAEASKALVLNASSNIVGINSLTATTLVGSLSTPAQTSITSVGILTSLSVSGATTLTAGTASTTTTTGTLVITGGLGVSGDINSSSITTSNDVIILGDLQLSGNATFVNYSLTKIADIDLSAQSDTIFYPVGIYQDLLGFYGDFPTINFQIVGQTIVSSDPYNETSIIGYARGGGWSDHSDLFNISIRNFSEGEYRILGLYKGTQSFQGGFVVYLRGGYSYNIQADCNATITAGTIGSALTIADSVFATKNSSFVDQTGTSANISLLQNLLVVSGTFSNLTQYNLKSNMADGAFIVNGIGKNHLAYNQAEFGYNHISDGSSSNYGFLGMYGFANALTWNGLKCIGIGKTPSTTTTTTTTTSGALTITGGLGLTGTIYNGGNIISDGKLGIGVNPQRADIHIKQSSNTAGGGLMVESNNSGADWNMLINASNRLEFLYDGASRGYLDPAVNVTNIDFTGQHRSITDNNNINNNIEQYIGLIVYATGSYQNINNSNIYINEALPKVELTNKYQDKRVFGVISNREDDNTDRTYTQGTFVSVMNKEEGDERLIINSVGEGMVWVCNKNGPIENGDLIVSAGISGYGTKQETIFVCNYTVGKITQDCDFSTPERYTDLLGNVVSKSVYDSNPSNHVKCNFVGCVYYCG